MQNILHSYVVAVALSAYIMTLCTFGACKNILGFAFLKV